MRAIAACLSVTCFGLSIVVGPPAPPAIAHGPAVQGTGNAYFLRNAHDGGNADLAYAYGTATDTVLVGDWDGDGTDTLAIRRGNTYYLKNSHSGGPADLTYAYGTATDTVLVGDWDGDGTDTLALRRGSTYYLKNSHSGGPADVTFAYGTATDVVLVGDWDGQGGDSFAVRRGNTYYLKNSLSGGAADLTYGYGSATDVVYTGDWDGNGTDTLGIRRAATYYLRNSHAAGNADFTYTYGTATDVTLVGDWDGNRTDTLGLRRDAAVPQAPVPAFIRGVHSSGRYFVDGAGRPVLVRGDSPRSMVTDLTVAEVTAWAANRQAHGFNAAVVSLVGAADNGAPSDTGATHDGLLPFEGGDITRPDPAYWTRVDAMLAALRDNGITAFLHPVDGWNIDNPETFGGESLAALRGYGAFLADRYASYPNIVWVVGGDDVTVADEPAEGSAADHAFNAVREGIRAAGDRRPFSVQLGGTRSVSTENPYWAPRVDWNVVHTYHPTYQATLDAYRRTPALPALFAEGNYERENDQGGTPPTTDETLRRQVLWALTSGSPGDVYGSDDWEFHPGWASRLDTAAVMQIKGVRAWFAGRAWHRLVPDTAAGFLTLGRGNPVGARTTADVLESDYATAALAADRSWGVIYVPTARTIGVAAGAVANVRDAYWLDPCSLARSARVTIGGAVAHPGVNSCGASDWLFVVEGA